jgi:DNA (cytosine-5)-methyltransferase 1
MKKLKVLSLFTGAGGFDIGFHEQDYEIICASDVWIESKKTFELNFPKTPFIHKDVRELSSEEILLKTKNKKPDVIIGGPPCQGFSVMGDKNSADPRNFLFENYVRLVRELNPKCFVFENVKGLKTMFNGRYLNNVINSFASIGFNVYVKTLNAQDYGVPQSRERVIVFGTRIENPFKFPESNSKNIGRLKVYKTCGEALKDLENKGKEIPNHLHLNHNEIVIQRYKLVKPGGKLPPPDKLPEKIRRKNFGNTYVRLDASKVAPTMVPGNNAFPIHPKLNHSLTPREAARIQSFPDDFIFSGPRKEQCKLVGNAVPPLLAAAIAKNVSLHLNNKIKTNDNYHEKFSLINESQKSKRPKKAYTCIDLFSGAGGISIGFEKAGYKILFSSDFDKAVEKTHKFNWPKTPFVGGDLSSDAIFNQIKKTYGGEEVDIIVGGPPCQGFSIYGKRRFVNTKDYDPHIDDRNKLVFTYLRYVKLFKPKWFLMENVPGIINLDGGWFIKELLKDIKKLGYSNCEYKIINTADYGVPQARKRFILIANRTNHIIPWPKPKYFDKPEEWQLPFRTIKEVLSNLDKTNSSKIYKNHDPMNHEDKVKKRFSYIKEGKKLNPADLPENLQYSKTGKKIQSFSKVFFRLDRNKPSPTLVPGHSAFPIHPWLDRQLTVREAARIQTFPDEIEFLGGSGDQCKQVGNAFPVLAAEVFANFIIKAIENNWTINNVSNLALYSLIEKGESYKS